MKIYDEALKELQEVVGEYGMDYYNDKHFPITIKALERAKKVEELLRLYRKAHPAVSVFNPYYNELVEKEKELEKIEWEKE